MRRIVAFLTICGFICAANAETSSDKPATYLLRLRVKDDAANPNGGERILAEPNIVTIADRPAVFHVGGQTKVADETIRDGTFLKVTVKKLKGDKVRVSGMLEVSNFINPPSENFVRRDATEFYFDHTVKLAEKIRLSTRPTAEAGGRVVEVTCHQVDSPESVRLSAETE